MNSRQQPRSRHHVDDLPQQKLREPIPLPSPQSLPSLTDFFFVTPGIGMLAPPRAPFKARGRVSDELIPGTLHVGHVVRTLIQAFIYIVIVRFEPMTLALTTAASVPAPPTAPALRPLIPVHARHARQSGNGRLTFSAALCKRCPPI